MIILGIDPGIATIGYGIIKKDGKKIECIDFGTIKTIPSWTTGDRLKKINQELNKLIKQHNPIIMAIENVYFFKNTKTAMPVSQAKGVIMFTAAKKKIPIYEFTPLQIKTTITGYGRAEKKQIKEMVKILLDLKETPKSDDAADALGAAICYTRTFDSKLLTNT